MSLLDQDLQSNEKLKQLQILYEFEKSFSENLDADIFLLDISKRLRQLTKAQAVLIVCCLEKDNPSLRLLSFERDDFTQVLNISKKFANKFIVKVKSGFRRQELEEVLDLNVRNHVGVPFHFTEMKGKKKEDIWGRVELINHPIGFNDSDLGFLNIVAEKVSASISRDNMLKQKVAAERLAIIGQLSSTIVHDFKNPMTSIRGFAELIKINGENMDKLQREKIASIIMSQVDRCTTMIEELLLFAKGDKKLHFECHNLESFLQEIAELLSVENEKRNIKIKYDFAFKGDVLIDKDRMMRVILNLTKNALEILEEGDELILSSCHGQNGNIELWITDTGPGVPQSLKLNLFEAFVTQGKETGTGLGLHIAKEIVEAHDGTLSLDEDYHDGARFIVSIPNKISHKLEEVS